jgi:hypothetical protein
MLRLRGGEASRRLLRQPWSPLQLLQGLPAQGSRRAFHRRRQDPAARTRMRSEASTGSASARSAHGWPARSRGRASRPGPQAPLLLRRLQAAAYRARKRAREQARQRAQDETTPAANSAKSRPAVNATALAAPRRRMPGPAAPAPTAGPAAATAVPTPPTTTRPPTTAPGAATRADTPRPPRPTSPRHATLDRARRALRFVRHGCH